MESNHLIIIAELVKLTEFFSIKVVCFGNDLDISHLSASAHRRHRQAGRPGKKTKAQTADKTVNSSKP